MAERLGFEPRDLRKRSTVFETVPFNHSGTSPGKLILSITDVFASILFPFAGKKVPEKSRRLFCHYTAAYLTAVV